MLADITRAANAFHAFGVSADHPVAFVLPNLPETHFTIWGGEAAGVVFAINPLLEPSQIAELLRAARVRVLVTLAPAPGIDLWTKLAPHLADAGRPAGRRSGSISRRISEDAADPPRDGEPSPPCGSGFEIVDFRQAMQEQPSDRLVAPRALSQSSISSYVCTGGTTGLPKIAVRTHGNEVFDAWAAGPGDRRQALPSAPFSAGCRSSMSTRRSSPDCCRGCRAITSCSVRPRAIEARGDRPVLGDRFALSHLDVLRSADALCRACSTCRSGTTTSRALSSRLCGAAPMPAKLIENFEAKTGIKILEGYGLTEGTCVSVGQPAGRRAACRLDRNAHSLSADAGRDPRRCRAFPAHGRDRRDRNTCDQRSKRLLWAISMPGTTRTSWIDIEGEPWLNTGDLGRQDEAWTFLALGSPQGTYHQGWAQHRSED